MYDDNWQAIDGFVPNGADDVTRTMLLDIAQRLPSPKRTRCGFRKYLTKMSDGVALSATVYFPSETGSWPVILARTPYSRPPGSEIMKGIAAIFALHGYVYVNQDCRGTGASDGEWTPFVNERRDGLETIAWITDQPWCDQRIALFGASYLTILQWLVADSLPRQVKTLFLCFGGTERYHQMYMNGMFRHEIYTMWAVENSGLKTDRAAGELYQEALKVVPHIEMDRQVFGDELPWYRDWVKQPQIDDPLWTEGLWKELVDVPPKVGVPVHMIAGWFDHHLDGMERAYRKLSENIRSKSRFVIGPWDHAFKTPEGRLEGTPGLIAPMAVDLALEWFGYHLKGHEYARRIGGVEAYVIGAGKWRWHETWPPASSVTTLYLDGHAGEVKSTNRLSVIPPAKETLLSYTYDPSRPVQTQGGAALLAWINPEFHGAVNGSVLQQPPGYRDDVLSFVTEPFTRDILLSGRVRVRLWVSSDAEDTAFAVMLMEVIDGQAFNVCDGVATLRFRNGDGKEVPYTPGAPVQTLIELWPVEWRIREHGRLRLDVSSSNFPMYNVHRNTAEPWCLQSRNVQAANSLHIGVQHPSCIDLPVGEFSAEEEEE